MDFGILAYGAYLPRCRLSRADIADAHSWLNPGLAALAEGERRVANWDEDAVTLAVAAVRNCLRGRDRDLPDITGLWLASTSFPIQDRQNAGIVADVLNLPVSMLTVDVDSISQCAGTTALISAIRDQAANHVLVAAGEKRRAKAGSMLEMTCGDGGAAFLIGWGDVVARCKGVHTVSVDLADYFRGQGKKFDHRWEDRWARDEGHMKVVPDSIAALLDKTGTKASEITRFCYPSALHGVGAGIAKKLGLADGCLVDNLQANCGEVGCAHPLVMFSHALDTAKPGELILVTGVGRGCDVLLFEAEGNAKRVAGRDSISAQLAGQGMDFDYRRYLALSGLTAIKHQGWALSKQRVGPVSHYRTRTMAQRMIGGRCSECGTDQLPKTRICVNPNCRAMDTQKDEPFAEKIGRLSSYTTDHLAVSSGSPAYYGKVEFPAGGQLTCDFTDIEAEQELTIDMAMEMCFRVKDYDDKRGRRRYFWKATPVGAGK